MQSLWRMVLQALAQRRLRAEVGDDLHQAVAQRRNGHAVRDLAHQAQRVDVAPDAVQQRPCTALNLHEYLIPKPSRLEAAACALTKLAKQRAQATLQHWYSLAD